MARRSDHSRDEIREMALRAVETIAAEQGFAALSARKIASEIGYTVGTLYLVFQNLDDLILHVNGRTLDRLYHALEHALTPEDAPREQILALGRAYIGFATDHPHLWSMIYEHAPPPEWQTPAWYRDKVARSFALVENALAPLARRRSAESVGQAARALWGGVHGICILALTDKLDTAGADHVLDLAETLIGHFLTGFASTRK